MRYSYNLILFLFLLGSTGPVLAQETRYRVEILVLSHLEQNEVPLEQLELSDYSMGTDFLTPPVEANESEAAGASPEEPLNAVSETGESPIAEDALAEIADVIEPLEDPNRVIHIEEMSGIMQEAWRRLRLSGPFRPEQYLSWEQGNQEPFPALRVHDLKAVMIDDPWAEFRTEPGNTSTVFVGAASLNALEATGEVEGPQLPDPVYYYRLDGTVMLKRSRFLHLHLDLELREAVWAQDILVAPGTSEKEDQPVRPSSFRVHELKQSRQVHTGRMEYFDGPVLGVLAWITVAEGESGETP